ncbi:MAG: hypothetical protein AAF862_07215, partial [Pseudomonadota bacterium]
ASGEVAETTFVQVTKRQGDLIITQFAKRGAKPVLVDKEPQGYYLALLDQLQFSDNGATRNN